MIGCCHCGAMQQQQQQHQQQRLPKLRTKAGEERNKKVAAEDATHTHICTIYAEDIHKCVGIMLQQCGWICLRAYLRA